MARSDAPLETASGRPSSVLRVLDEMKGRYEKADRARQLAKRMEVFFYGRFFNGRGYALESQVNLRSSLWAPPVTKNKIKNLGLSYVARIAKMGETTLAYPGTTRLEDQAGAEVANAILDWQRQTQDRDALLFRTLLLAVLHGTSASYVTWDIGDGPHLEREAVIDPLTNMPARGPDGEVIYQDAQGMGVPHVEALSMFDFITDGAKDVYKDGRWLMVRRYLDPDVAEARLRQAGINRTPGTVNVRARLAQSESRDLVEGYEMWWRPGVDSRFPEGFYACVVDGDTVEAMTYPYAHGRLPINVLRLVDVEDDFWGATWLEDAIPMQIGLNHSWRVLANRVEVSGQIRGLGFGPAIHEWGDAPDAMIDVGSKDGLESIVFPEVPEVPKDFYEVLDRYEAGIADVAAVSAVSSQGDAAAETKNATLVSYATQIDETMSAHTVANLNEMTLHVDTQILELVKQFVPRQRLFSVVGEDGAVSADYFAGTEIGNNIRLEVAPATARQRAAKRQEAAAAAQMGDPTGAERARTGLDLTMDQGAARAAVQSLIERAMNGEAVQADPSIPAEIAVQDLRTALGQVASDPQKSMPIRALLHQYEELKAQQAQQAQQMPIQPAGAPAVPPSPTDPGQGQSAAPGTTPLVH